ncbi:Fc.00g089190.m01.CDS01 [Cosmosporella sp. VM-42]
MFKAYKNLSTKARLGVGVGIIAWGAAGLYLSDQAEEKFGYTPTEEDKAELSRYTPKIITVEKNQEK